MDSKAYECIKYAESEKGIEQIDIVCVQNELFGVSVRHGKFEKIEDSVTKNFCIRVIHNNRQATVLKTSLDDYKDDIDLLLGMTKCLPQDDCTGLPSSDGLVFGETYEVQNIKRPSEKELIEMATQLESSALENGACDIEVADVSYKNSYYAFCGSNNASGTLSRSFISCYIAAVAKGDNEMQQGDKYKISCSDMPSFVEVGAEAARISCSRLGSKKMRSGKMPVIMDKVVAKDFLEHILEALNGRSISSGSSMFVDKMNERCFNSNVSIIDDPLVPNGIRSTPFDAEGFRVEPFLLVRHGHIRNYTLDTYTSRKLKMINNKRASRSGAGIPVPSCTNVVLQPTEKSFSDAVKSIKYGVLIDGFIGMGVNLLTGDYSRGCTGFLIENGEVKYPVSEITVSGNLKDFFKMMIPLDDLVIEFGIDSPSIYIDEATISGI